MNRWDPPTLLEEYDRDRARIIRKHLRQQAENARELAALDEKIAKVKAFIKEHT